MRYSPGDPTPNFSGNVTRKEMARAMRDLFDERGIPALLKILNSRNNAAILGALRLIAEYGFGKPTDMRILARMEAPASITPEAILLEMAGQHVPRELAGTADDDESDDDFDD